MLISRPAGSKNDERQEGLVKRECDQGASETWLRHNLRSMCGIDLNQCTDCNTADGALGQTTGFSLDAGKRHRDVASGSRTEVSARRLDVCFAPMSGHLQAALAFRFCAMSGSERTHSITSSARVSRVGGNARPSAFAVLRLMVRLNLVGCSTGRSPGFAPRRILSTYWEARRNRSCMSGP
jgi:hypothetical protein